MIEKVKKVALYLLLMGAVFPMVFMAVMLLAATGTMIGEKFSTSLVILSKMYGIKKMIDPKTHKQFWREL